MDKFDAHVVALTALSYRLKDVFNCWLIAWEQKDGEDMIFWSKKIQEIIDARKFFAFNH